MKRFPLVYNRSPKGGITFLFETRKYDASKGAS